jgi:transposase
MAMGRLSNRRGTGRPSSQLAVALAPRHAFYDRCNELLAAAEFDATVEMLCQAYYKDEIGRPSIPSGRYFRMLFVGQLEGLDSEREIAWRCADSLSLHRFLRLAEGETVPDHSTLSVTRRRLPLEVHHAVFDFILEISTIWFLVGASVLMPRPKKPTLPCAAWSAATAAKITRRCCAAWPGRAALRP